jgi:aldose 1-epimerase
VSSLAALPLGEIVALASGDTVLEVTPQCGARLVSFRAAGEDILRPLIARDRTPAPPPYDFAGFPLLPYSGPVFGGGFAFEGKTFSLARTIAAEGDAVHGDGWTGNWATESRTTDGIALRYDHAPSPGTFPFQWTGRLTYTVSANALSISIALTNTDPRAFPAGMGFHPYFPRRPGTRLQFIHGEVWPADSPEAVAVEPAVIEGLDFSAGQDVTRLAVDRCFEGWLGSARITSPGGRSVTVTASPEFGKLQLYLPWDDPFLCVEPVTNANDGFNRARHGVLRHGVVRLAPGQTLSGTIRIEAGTGYGVAGPAE